MGHFFRNFWWKKLLVQVRSRSYEVIRGTTSNKISAEIVRKCNLAWCHWFESDSWWDWCQYMTMRPLTLCHMSFKVNLDHLRSLTSDEFTMTNSQSAYVQWGFLRCWIWICGSLFLKSSPNHFFTIPLANHRHSINLNFDRYGDDSQRGWCRST